MLKAREILRLKHEIGLSLREIGKSCNCCKTKPWVFPLHPRYNCSFWVWHTNI